MISKIMNLFTEKKEEIISPFQTSIDIDDPNLIFGREEELQNLCGYAEGLNQVQIIGARRYGKTCLIKCFITLTKRNPNSRVYPVFLDPDPYSVLIQGNSNVYRYIIAQIISSLYNDELIKRKLLIEGHIIRPDSKWNKIFKQLAGIDDIDMFGFFDEAVNCVSKLLDKTVLVIFDEYEKATDAFDSIKALMHLRTFANSSSKTFKFWLVGGQTWSRYTEDKDLKGSGVFNGVTIDLFVKPIKYEDFQIMWDYECGLIPDEKKRKELKEYCEKTFLSSGGVPCFAKIIGAKLLVENEYPLYNCLKVQFSEILKNLKKGEIRSLRELQSSRKQYTDEDVSNSIDSLIEYGLIVEDNNSFFIPSRFFEDFIRAGIIDENNIECDEPTIDKTILDIKTLYYNINDRYNNLYGKFMFDPTNDTVNLFDDLSKRCDSKEKVPNFINTIYLLYWEGAKENGKAGEKLPEFFKKTPFRKAMDTLRHVLGKAHQQDKLEQKSGQTDKPTALKVIWGDETEPQSSLDCLRFQDCMLNQFLQELTELYESIGKELREGEEYDGVIVEVVGSDGLIHKNVRYRYCSYPLRPGSGNLDIMSDGDIVRFIAKEQKDVSNPFKTYWRAYNIRLK